MNKNIKIFLNYFLGPLLFVLLAVSLYRQIIQQTDLAFRFQVIKSSWLQWKFWLVVLMMFLNWGIEARKWQVLMRHLQRVSFFQSFKSVLAGSSITMLTPNRVGEYGGRILYVEEENRVKAISLTIIGSLSQLLVTLILGCAGLLYLKYFSANSNALNMLPEVWSNMLLSLSALVTFLLLLFYFRIGWLVRVISKIQSLQKIVKHIYVLDELNYRQLLHILYLSFIRYSVFVVQYILLLQVMGTGIEGWVVFWLMSVFYLVMAIAPTFGFIELPLRAKASWELLKYYTTNDLGVGAAALGIWLINLVIPAIIGSLFILSVKIIKDR